MFVILQSNCRKESHTDHPFDRMNQIRKRYTMEEGILPSANENIEPVPVVQVMPHRRLDISRGISEEELMSQMRTRLKAMFS